MSESLTEGDQREVGDLQECVIISGGGGYQRMQVWKECWKASSWETSIKKLYKIFVSLPQFIGRTDVEAETPILWPPDAKSWLTWKDPDAGKDWGQEEKGMTENEVVGWHHQLDGHGFGWTPGAGDGQGGLACCGSWGCKKLDTTE